MIEEAGLGICVIGKEGASGEALRKADVMSQISSMPLISC